jgi:hypothetical protein
VIILIVIFIITREYCHLLHLPNLQAQALQ